MNKLFFIFYLIFCYQNIIVTSENNSSIFKPILVTSVVVGITTSLITRIIFNNQIQSLIEENIKLNNKNLDLKEELNILIEKDKESAAFHNKLYADLIRLSNDNKQLKKDNEHLLFEISKQNKK